MSVYTSEECTAEFYISSSELNAPLEPGKTNTFRMIVLDGSENELCEVGFFDYAVPVFDCTHRLTLDRPDAVSISARLPSFGNSVGSFHVWLDRFNDYVFESPRIVETGRYDSELILESDRKNISLSIGSVINVSYSYSFNGDSSQCTSDTALLTIPGPSCYQSPFILKQVGTSVFLAIGEPRPLEGACKLILLSCDGVASLDVDIEIDMPSCGEPVELSFRTIKSLLSTAIPGKACTFTWSYSYGSNSCVSSNNVVTPPFREECFLTESIKSEGLITLSPSVNTLLVNGVCQVSLTGCDGVAVRPSVKKTFPSCESSETVSFSQTDSVLIRADSTCLFILSQVATDSADYACDSSPVSFTTSTTPSWTQTDGRIDLSVLGGNCVEVFWDYVDNTGGSPLLCYLVWRRDGSERWYLVQDCGQSRPGSRRYLSCGYTLTVPVQFKVYAMNRNGLSDSPITSATFRIEHMLLAPQASIIQPTGPGPFMSGSFPLIGVEVDSETSSRILVFHVINQTSPDTLTRTILDPQPDGSFIFTGILRNDANVPPGTYQLMDDIDFIPTGNYSLIVSSLEQGGLRAQYWTNVFFQGEPSYEKKDSIISFDWTAQSVINDTAIGLTLFDLVSVRWTGFIKPLFSEPYNVSFRTHQYLRVWLQNDLVVDSWSSPCPGLCSFTREMNRTLYYSIRIDYFISRGFGQRYGGDVAMAWQSYSQNIELVPSRNLFQSIFIENGGNYFQPIQVVPDLLSAEHSTVSMPTKPVVAGEYFSIFILAKDRFGQPRLDSTPDVFTCTLSSDLTSMTVLAIPAVPSDGTGRYEILSRLLIAGSYRVSIADISGAIVPTSGLTVTIVPAAAWELMASSLIVQQVKIANQSISVSVGLKDRFGNVLNGSISGLPELRVAIKWAFDLVSLSRLGPNTNDNLNRTATHGITFESLGVEWDSELELFTVNVTTPLSGTYNEVILSLPNTESLLPSWTVDASTTASPNNSILVSPIQFPPTDVVAAEPVSLEVQLRDVFKNCIDAIPVLGLWPSSPVRIKLGALERECFPKQSGGVPGVFTCSITPLLAGLVELSITVNGVHASTIPDTPIPWNIYVRPALIDGSKSVVTGLVDSYSVSDVANGALSLYLRDAYLNFISSLNGYTPSISVDFLNADSSTAFSLNPRTFVWETADGSITVPLFSTRPGTFTLRVVVEGEIAAIPSPVVEFRSGWGFALTSSCTTMGSGHEAGSLIAITCSIRDWLGNPLDNPLGLFLEARAVSNDLSAKNSYSWKGEYSSGNDYVATAYLTIAGHYSVTPILGQPGGLVAKFYADTQFSNLIVVAGNQPLFTQIDDSLEHEWNGAMPLSAQSVEWSGLIVPPAALTVRFFISVSGGVRFQLGQAVLLDQLSPRDRVITTSVDYTFLTMMPLSISVQYIASTAARVKITWQYPDVDGGAGFSIPPTALLSPLAVPIDNPIFTISPAGISSSSLVTTPKTQKRDDFFLIQALDPFGNRVVSFPPCAPSCLFDIFLEQPDGTPIPSISLVSNGLFRVDVSFATDGRKTVHVQLVTGNDRSELSGSPFTITVTR